jgi:hypothetical protein
VLLIFTYRLESVTAMKDKLDAQLEEKYQEIEDTRKQLRSTVRL